MPLQLQPCILKLHWRSDKKWKFENTEYSMALLGLYEHYVPNYACGKTQWIFSHHSKCKKGTNRSHTTAFMTCSQWAAKIFAKVKVHLLQTVSLNTFNVLLSLSRLGISALEKTALHLSQCGMSSNAYTYFITSPKSTFSCWPFLFKATPLLSYENTRQQLYLIFSDAK